MVEVLGALSLTFAVSSASAQAVYKCVAGRSVTYSNEPCLGAQVVDTTPTQGMDKSSGVSRKGEAVQNTEFRKAIADALKPLTGMNAQQLQTAGRRRKLTTAAQLECNLLDEQLPQQEALTVSPKSSTAKLTATLFESRRRYRELNC